MRYALVLSLVIGLVIGLASRAFADDEPTLAVRIEAKVPEASKRAVALGKALRAVAKTKRRAKASADIDAAVVNADCSILQPTCAASIGDKLGVTHVMVGQLDKRGARYVLTLSLISVRTKQRVRSLRDVTGATADLRKMATSLYTRMLDEGAGELVIVSNARRGQVFIDGLGVTELYEGRASVTGVALGTHEVEIRASGYRPFTVDVTVEGRTEENFLLEPTQ